jgi:hypothetical protein
MKEENRKQQERPIPPPPPLINPVAPEVEIPPEKPILKPNENKELSSTNNRCVWRDSSPINTTFEVRYFIY